MAKVLVPCYHKTCHLIQTSLKEKQQWFVDTMVKSVGHGKASFSRSALQGAAEELGVTRQRPQLQLILG